MTKVRSLSLSVSHTLKYFLFSPVFGMYVNKMMYSADYDDDDDDPGLLWLFIVIIRVVAVVVFVIVGFILLLDA